MADVRLGPHLFVAFFRLLTFHHCNRAGSTAEDASGERVKFLGMEGNVKRLRVDFVSDVVVNTDSNTVEISGTMGLRRPVIVSLPRYALHEMLQADLRAEESGYLLEEDFQIETPILVPESINLEAARDMGLVFRFHLPDGKQAAFIVPSGVQFEQLLEAARTVSEGLCLVDDNRISPAN